MFRIRRQTITNGKVIHSGDFESVKDCLEDGVKKGISFEYADLHGEDLCYADLHGANLRNANLRHVDLCHVDLSGADLYRADLTYADLRGANLRNADLRNATIFRADLRYADLYSADLRNANLQSVFLHGTKFWNAIIINTYFSEPVTVISNGEPYYLFLSKQNVTVRCQTHTEAEWRSMSRGQIEEIEEMDRKKALDFYPRLLDLLDIYLGKGERPEWIKD